MLKKARGQIMILAIVFMGILLAMSSSVVGYTIIHTTAEKQTMGLEQSYQAAEAGIDQAIYQLNQNSNFTGETNISFGSSTYSTAVTTIDSNHKRITATANTKLGDAPTSTRIIAATAAIDLDTISFTTAIQVGAGGLNMNNSSKINGNVFSNGNISGSGTITGDAFVAADTTPPADQSWTIQNTDVEFGKKASRTAVAQSFIPTATAAVGIVKIYIKKVGNPGDLTYQIVTNNNGVPSQTVIRSGTFQASAISESYSWLYGIFASPPTLTANTKYWLMLLEPVNSSNYYIWGLDSGNGFANNIGMYTNSWIGGTWNPAEGDFNFGIEFLGSNPTTSLSGVTVNGNAQAARLTSCTIGGNATWKIQNTCTVGGSNIPGTNPPAPAAFPIPSSQITEWENAAASGTIYNGDYNLSNDETASLGPTKIIGDLKLSNQSILTLNGPLWVVGNIYLSNSSKLLIDTTVGDAGVPIIADKPTASTTKGQITISNSVIIAGNGQPHSFPLLISGYKGTSGAIYLSNTSTGTIYYAPYGEINVSNSATALELTGYKITMSNSATINYKTGLQNANFVSGPGGAWAFQRGTYAIIK